MNRDSNLVLVTGATGWLGRRLLETLTSGESGWATPYRSTELKVRALIKPNDAPDIIRSISKEIEIVTGDLLIPSDCRRFCTNAAGSILFHTAGIIHPTRVSEFYEVNVKCSENILESARDAMVKRCIVMSSNSPFGMNLSKDKPFTEESQYAPYMNYGLSKMKMELLVKDMQATGKLETVIIRSPWFYGPNQPVRQTKFFRMIKQGKVPIVGSGENLRSMAYVDNICQGLLLAALSECANGQIFWIADERPYTFKEIINTIRNLMEAEFDIACSPRVIRLPRLACTIARHADNAIQSIGLYNSKLHVLSELHSDIICSSLKAQKMLGYCPEIELTEGMRRSLRSVGRDAIVKN